MSELLYKQHPTLGGVLTNQSRIIAQDQVDVYSVSAIAKQIKACIDGRFADIKIKGEISGVKYADSGHVFFSLKDSEALLHATCWRHIASSLPIKLEDGLEVICTGSVTTYPTRSVYQLSVAKVEMAGVGALLKMLEQRKKALAAEGLFDRGRKKKLPYMPKVIGIITSTTGAVIKDMLHRIKDRCGVQVIVWGVNVQGADSAEQVAAALDGFNAIGNDNNSIPRPDVLIVARGGGSIEDLWAFNEEVVVRATARSIIPVVSAIGHEVDTTLIDYAADLRAPTPTAAAELVLPVKLELIKQVDTLKSRMFTVLPHFLERKKVIMDNMLMRANSITKKWDLLQQRIGTLTQRSYYIMQKRAVSEASRLVQLQCRVKLQDITKICESFSVKVINTNDRAYIAINNIIKHYSLHTHNISKLLESYSYRNILSRGFAIVRNTENRAIISSAEAAKNANYITIELKDGEVCTVVKKTDK